MNPSKFADYMPRCPSESSQSTMVDSSSVVLKSLLGVNDIYSSMKEANQNQTMNLHEKVCSNSNVDESSSELMTCPGRTVSAPTIRGILRSSSVEKSPLSLQDVIEKITARTVRTSQILSEQVLHPGPRGILGL